MHGHVDRFCEDGIAGWAHDPESPESRPQLLVFIDGSLAGVSIASSFRPDVKAAGFGEGIAGFWFDPRPYLVGETNSVRIAFGTTGETVPNGRKSLQRSNILSVPDWDLPNPMASPALPPIERINAFPREKWPLISVIVPTFNTPLALLRSALASVRAQTYCRWELIVADDGSTDHRVIDWLRAEFSNDPKCQLIVLPDNQGISTATNAGVNAATGEFVAFLDHDDELTSEALAEVSSALLIDPAIDIVYTDQDKWDEAGNVVDNFFKPDWSPVYFLGVMYVGHLLVMRRSLFQRIGGCDSRYDKVQDYELMLRASEATNRIHHIRQILYHWRTVSGSIASSIDAKSGIGELQEKAVQAHLDRTQIPLKARAHPILPHRVQLSPASCRPKNPRISIVIPTRDAPEHLERCLKSIYERSTYENFEVIAVDTGSTDPQALRVQDSFPIRVLKDLGPFNFARANNLAALEASGQILVFLNNDTEVVTSDWLEILASHLRIPKVGAVGPLLLYPEGSVQHAGVVLGFRGTADHVMRGFDSSSDGYAGSLSCSRETMAVTAACMMVRRDFYQRIGGMNQGYASIYQDVDFCLRINEHGLSTVFVANAKLMHHESMSRGSEYNHVDRALFIDRWKHLLEAGDPFYNPHFTRNKWDYSLRRT